METLRQSAPGTAPSVLDEVRDYARFVTERARDVRIDESKIPAYAESLLRQYKITTQLNDDHFKSGEDEKTASYIVALDSLNFGSGYFRQARDQQGIDFGYTVFARGLKDAFARGVLDTPQKWLSAKEEDFSRIFNFASGVSPPMDELFRHFTRHLRESGRQIVDNYQGTSLSFVESAGGSAAKLVETVSQWPTFRDYAVYDGREGPILKRAQILAADLHLARIGGFNDVSGLTTFADNRLPHILRSDGILSYSDDLAQKIERLELIPSGSPQEVEMRAASIHAVELIRDAARAQGHNVTAVNMDHMLWHRGGEPAAKAKPSHRTLSVWY